MTNETTNSTDYYSDNLLFPTFESNQDKGQAENFIKENFRYYDYRYDLFVIDSVNTNFDNFKEGDFNHDGIIQERNSCWQLALVIAGLILVLIGIFDKQ